MTRTIGFFVADGEDFTGRIETLTFQHKAVFVPNLPKLGAKDPDFLLFANAVQLGEAWRSTDDKAQTYLDVLLDDPCFAQPTHCSLLRDEKYGYVLVWKR